MFEAVEHGAGSVRERPFAAVADIAAFRVRVDANPSGCITAGVGAYYQLRTQRWECVFGHTAQ
jgi:hypothetical protein